jgi:PAS domain S-box-containing protein
MSGWELNNRRLCKLIRVAMRKINLKSIFSPGKSNSVNAWKSILILIVGFGITGLAVYYTRIDEREIRNREFTLVCNDIRTKILTRLHAHALLLRTGSAFFAGSDTVSRNDWKTFIECAKVDRNLPGIQGVGFTKIIPANKLSEHIQEVRREGFPDYTVKPSGKRDVYTSIVYLEPFAGRNLRAFGYDMFSEPVRRKAMEVARDSNVAMLTGRVLLVQETSKDVQFGTLMYVPVYRNGMPVNTVEQRRAAILGWVYSPYRMNDLMHGILGQWDDILPDRIHLRIYDHTASANNLLFDSQKGEAPGKQESSSLIVTLPVMFNAEKWILSFDKSPEQNFFSSKVNIIASSGIAVSLMLFALSLSLFNTRTRAEQIAIGLTKDLTESEERFRTLLNSTSEGIYGIDLQGLCTFSNTACRQLIGYEGDMELIGENMHSLIHHSLADGTLNDESECRVHKSFLKGEAIHVSDEVFWRVDGTFFPVEYWSNPIMIDGKQEGSVISFFNITERKLAEEKIRQARAEAEQASEAKSAFLSRVSHELRTPMNAVLGFAQLMGMGELTPSHRKGVNHILDSGKHLLGLINEILDITDIETGKLALSVQPVSLSGVLIEALDELNTEVLAKDMKTILIDSPANEFFLLADPGRLKKVLSNLIGNAVKYGRHGGKVIIKTELLKTFPDEVARIRISILDDGIGIKPENIEKLFKPFERIGTERHENEGTGLGLTVVKKLMEAMLGSFGAESVYGKGSTFWIELPLAEQQVDVV